MPCLKEIKNNVGQLTLKKPFLCPYFTTDNDAEELFLLIQLNDNLSAHDVVQDLKDHPKLLQYLNHYCCEHTYLLINCVSYMLKRRSPLNNQKILNMLLINFYALVAHV